MINNRILKFFSLYRPYKGLFAADIACTLIVCAINLAFPMLMRDIIERVTGSGAFAAETAVKMGGLMIALLLARAGCDYFKDAMGHGMGAMMERDMRIELFEKILGRPFKFFDEKPTGELLSRITNDLINLSELFHHGPEDIIQYALTFIGVVVILFWLNPLLALCMCAVLPFMAAYSIIFSKKLINAYRAGRERISDVNSRLDDSLSGVRVAKSYANESLEHSRFSTANEGFYNARRAIYTGEAKFFTVLSRIFAELTPIIAIVAGGLLISRQSLSPADLVAFLLYAGYLTAPLGQIARVSQQYQEGWAGFSRFMDVLEMESEPSGDLKPEVKGGIELNDIRFGYDGEELFKGLSLKIMAGERVALVGGSGVGKTTLCSLIPRFYEPQEGEILIDGVNLKDIDTAHLRRNVGVVMQETYLFTGTVLNNILYGKPGATLEQAIEAAKKAGAHDFITQLPNGYETNVGPKGVRLSGGERQRISIARAFLKNPPVLILDEATSQLDAHSERIVRQSLNELSMGRTTLIIAHRLSTIRNADRIIVLKDGAIAEQGPHDELMRLGGVYAKLYNAL